MSLMDAFRATVAAGPLPDTDHTAAERKRRLALSEWHLRESVLRDAGGDFEEAEGHLEDAREFLELATGRKVRAADADALRFELQRELDK